MMIAWRMLMMRIASKNILSQKMTGRLVNFKMKLNKKPLIGGSDQDKDLTPRRVISTLQLYEFYLQDFFISFSFLLLFFLLSYFYFLIDSLRLLCYRCHTRPIGLARDNRHDNSEERHTPSNPPDAVRLTNSWIYTKLNMSHK